VSNPRFGDFEALLQNADDRAIKCIRCGYTAGIHHGDRAQDSPPGCGWTFQMVIAAAKVDS